MKTKYLCKIYGFKETIFFIDVKLEGSLDELPDDKWNVDVYNLPHDLISNKHFISVEQAAEFIRDFIDDNYVAYSS